MARKKPTPFKPWETMKDNGIENRYIRMGDTQMLHPAFLHLSASAKELYLYMKLESAGKLIFEMPKSKYLKFMTNPTFERAKKELISAGFLEIEADRRHQFKATQYRFSVKWKGGKEPS